MSKENHAGVMNSGDTGGFSGTKQGQEVLGDEGPGYPMGKHDSQDVGTSTRGGGRASGSSHSSNGADSKGPGGKDGK